MGKFIGMRLLQLIPILIGITFLSFALMHSAEGDAVDVFYDRSGAVADEVKAIKRAELGLDKPFLTQYMNWVFGIATGNMGRSFISNKLVFETFADKLPATIELMVISMLFTICIATPLGILAAVRQNALTDNLIRFCSFIGNSLPNFLVALLLIYFFALKLNLLPIMGNAEDWKSIILPAVTLTISMGAKYTRQIRAIVLDELEKPYVIGARARGVSEGTILCKSVLKTVLITIITLLALSIGSLLGGTAIVESIFLWDGVGKMAVDAILMRDYPIIQAYVIWMAIIYVVINLSADLLYHYLDPRIRLNRKEE
ncbi:MAG: nickel transporter permease subunit NikB [Firmicutes bacterium]|nr:nickel transporter permease subunit NikB [Bacillota bacterium]